jgi:sulfur carrier protein ThiS
MKITLKLFATLAAHLPSESRSKGQAELELAPETTVQALIDQRGLPPKLCTLVLVNGLYVAPGDLAGQVLREGDVLAIWPPVGGG